MVSFASQNGLPSRDDVVLYPATIQSAVTPGSAVVVPTSGDGADPTHGEDTCSSSTSLVPACTRDEKTRRRPRAPHCNVDDALPVMKSCELVIRLRSATNRQGTLRDHISNVDTAPEGNSSTTPADTTHLHSSHNSQRAKCGETPERDRARGHPNKTQRHVTIDAPAAQIDPSSRHSQLPKSMTAEPTSAAPETSGTSQCREKSHQADAYQPEVCRSNAPRHVATLATNARYQGRPRRSSLPASLFHRAPTAEEKHPLAATDGSSALHAGEKSSSNWESKRKRRSSASPVLLLNAMVQYIEQKAEQSVFPEQSLPYMTPRLEVRQSQRVYTLADSHAGSGASSKAGSKPGSIPGSPPNAVVGARNKLMNFPCFSEKNAARNHDGSTMVNGKTVEELEAEGETKRAAFREELNRRKREGMKQRKHHSLERILRRMKFQRKQNEFGERVDFDIYSHTGVPWTVVVYVLILAAVYLIEDNVPDARTWLKEHWRFALVKFDTGIDTQKCSLDARGEVWRYMTYQFLHGGKQHLISNSVTGLVLGAAFEWTHGHVNFIVVLQVGVIVGCLTVAVFKPLSIIIGASGGVYALGGAHLASLLLNWNTMRCLGLSVRVISITSWCAWELLQQLGVGVNKLVNVSHECHFGGFFCGVLVGVWFSDNLVLGRWDKCLKLGGFAVGFVLIVTGVVYVAINDVSTC